tara:strand:- start:108 stop:830 length:723 start_codon:yes stop_codon:yes gene_type:complete
MKNQTKNYIILRSLQRSGTHAISKWLLQDENARFSNNISSFHKTLTNFNSTIKLEENESLISNKLKRQADNLHIFGIELQNVWYNLNPETDAQQNNILLIRSPINWFSSFITHKSRSPTNIYLFTQMWKTYAYEFIGETNYLKNKINIYFDEWVANKEYRKNIYERFENLGFNFNYKNTDFISSKGGGSSFSGQSIQGKELSANVLDRLSFLEGAHLDCTIKMSQDEEIKYLHNKIKKEI